VHAFRVDSFTTEGVRVTSVKALALRIELSFTQR